MKKITQLIYNVIAKLKIKDVKQYHPIVFLNSPISDETEDVLGIKSAADAIVEAVEQSANMIGLIADYGAGKSSLTSMLSEDKLHFRKVIHINMWDTISGLSSDDSNNDAVSALTKSFVFQLAAGVSENTARYINRRLSKNYGIISFSLSSLAFWGWFLAAMFFYGVYAIVNSIDVAVLGRIIYSASSVEKSYIYAEIAKSIAPILGIISIILLLLGLRKTNVAYSYWKSNNLEPEINDIFEAYYFVYKKLLQNKKRTLIVIEDLDRISDRELVLGFLREVYRFGSVVPPSEKKTPVFLIAVMPEVNLVNSKNDAPETPSEEAGIAPYPKIDEAVYEKMFDYTVTLRPIHYEDYADILLDIIGGKSSQKRKAINELLDEKKIEDSLPSSFNWLIKGHNLTMRQLKERLNAAMALLVTLKNKGYANQSFVSFSSCSAVTYLEHQYPELFNTFIAREDELSKLVQKCYIAKNGNQEDRERDFDSALKSFFSVEVFGNNNSIENMQDDVREMLLCGDIADDFRMYFYSFPKHSYIKNSNERDIYNLLVRPKEYPEDSDLDEKIQRLIDTGKTGVIKKTIEDIVARNGLLPKVILINKYLFQTALTASLQSVLKCAKTYISWNMNKFQDSQLLVEYVFSYGLEEFRDFWKSYAQWLSNTFSRYDDNSKIDIRVRLINVFGNDITIFSGLYEGTNEAPQFVLEENEECSESLLISDKELRLIPSRDVAVSLINIELINEEDVEYILSFLNKEPATSACCDKILSIYKHVSNVAVANSQWKNVIAFLTLNQIVDNELFSYALSGIEKESEVDRGEIGNYLHVIHHDIISDRYYELIDEYLIDVNLPDYVIDALFEKGLLTALISYCTEKGSISKYDFTLSNYIEPLKNACLRLNVERFDCILRFRQELLRQYLSKNIVESLCNELIDLFYDDFPCISDVEMEIIPDAIILLKLLNRAKVTENNYSAIISRINLLVDEIDIKEFFRYLLSTEFDDQYPDKEIVNEIINALDYTKICIDSLEDDDKTTIIQFIKSYRDLSNYETAKNFMLLVNCLIPELEIIVAEQSVSIYADTILKIGNPSGFTLDWVRETEVTYALPIQVLDYLLRSNYLQKYLIGKVLLEKYFEFPYEEVSNDIVAEEYNPQSPIWDHIRDNANLINYILQNEKYNDFDDSDYPEILLPLYKGKQTVAFAKHVLAHTNKDGQKFYLTNMGEICDEDNSVAISKLLLEDGYIHLLRDDGLFWRVHERLWEHAPKHSGYKSFFSRKRNEWVKNN